MLTWSQLLLVLWVLLSILLYWAVALSSAWVRRGEEGGRAARLLGAYRGRPWAWLLLQSFKLVYFLGLPYAALMQGAISPHWMGLVHFDLYASLGMGGLLTVGAFTLLSFDWWIYLRSLARSAGTLRPLPLWGGNGGSPGSAGLASGLMGVLLLEVHWAFYRGACSSFFGDYAGAFLGIALVGVEWCADLSLNGGINRAEERESFLHQATLAFIIAVIYIYTRNFWVCVAAHALLHMGLVRWIQFWGKRYEWGKGSGFQMGHARAGFEPVRSQANRQRHRDQRREHYGRQDTDPFEV